MRTLNSVSEFQTEAANAVFTKQQAISATLQDRKSTRLNSSHIQKSRMPSSA